jgi:hypothetical protein
MNCGAKMCVITKGIDSGIYLGVYGEWTGCASDAIKFVNVVAALKFMRARNDYHSLYARPITPDWTGE